MFFVKASLTNNKDRYIAVPRGKANSRVQVLVIDLGGFDIYLVQFDSDSRYFVLSFAYLPCGAIEDRYKQIF